MKKHKIPESSPLYSFADKLKALRDKENLSNKQLKERIESHLGYEFSEATLNNWLQHFSFPEYDKLVAICKAFPPYSVDYFMGVINDEPSYDLTFIEQNTGLKWETIERIKRLSDKYPNTINTVLDNDLIDTIVKNTDASFKEEYSIKKMERDANMAIIDYIGIFYNQTINYPANNSMIIWERENEIEKISKKISELSPQNIDNSFPAVRIEKYRRQVIQNVDTFFDENIPKLKSIRYNELINLYNQYIKPILDKDIYTDEYYNNVLFPLFQTITAEPKFDSLDELNNWFYEEYGVKNRYTEEEAREKMYLNTQKNTQKTL